MKLSANGVGQTIVVVIVTVAYFGMLGFCLINAYIPWYATEFDSLLKWSAIPGTLWGYYFGQKVYAHVTRPGP
jgi:hypothetical protein